MPFKQFHDFARARGGEHPGQPVHSDLHFDVWVSLSASRPPLYYLIDDEGRRIEFCSPAEAIAHGRGGIALPRPATNQPGDGAEQMDAEFRRGEDEAPEA